jgi:hypothetical protein
VHICANCGKDSSKCGKVYFRRIKGKLYSVELCQACKILFESTGKFPIPDWEIEGNYQEAM